MDGAPVARAGYVDVAGARLSYEAAGEGPRVVFLHGGLLDRHVWDAQFFARRRRVIRYDMRSAGETETAPSAEPLRHHEDLRGLLRGQKPAEFNAIVAEFLITGVDRRRSTRTEGRNSTP